MHRVNDKDHELKSYSFTYSALFQMKTLVIEVKNQASTFVQSSMSQTVIAMNILFTLIK